MTTTTTEKLEILRKEYIEKMQVELEDLSTVSLVWAYNDYLDSIGYSDDRIYSFDDLDELCSHMRPTEIIDKFGDLQNCDWFTWGVYIEAVNPNEEIDFEELAEYCLENSEYYNSEMQFLLYEYEDRIAEIEDEDEEEE